MNKIIFAGGCFWGVEEYFSRLNGVLTTTCIYIDGNTKNPKYEELKNNTATHAEAVLISYDKSIISLDRLLYHFLQIVDPFSLNKQGNDVGSQYRSGIFYFDNNDFKNICEYMLEYFEENIKNVKIVVTSAGDFYVSEEFHQKYLKKNPNGYCHVSFESIDKGELKK